MLRVRKTSPEGGTPCLVMSRHLPGLSDRGLHVAAAGSNINGPSSAPKFDRPMARRRGVIMMKRLLLILLALAMAAGLTPLAMWQAQPASYADPPLERPLAGT